jgi:hypothetical protein
MAKQSLRNRVVVVLSILLFQVNLALAQDANLRISRPDRHEKTYQRNTLTGKLERESVFRRLQTEGEIQGHSINRRDAERRIVKDWEKPVAVAAQLSTQSFGTGGGDINEVEPNNLTAQGISLPVNVFGRISFDGDVDYFAFQALAGQPLVIEPFATRLRNSDLVADIGLFTASGQLLKRVFGDAGNDPLLTYTPAIDEVLIVGIADVDDFGGFSYDYILNITRGTDANESEPNDRTAQSLTALPITVFGDVTVRDDVDFYSFIAEAGQTLIVDVDAEVLGSRLDAEINLQDPQTGQEYFYNDQWDGDDPRFNIVLPYTGRYVIGIGAFNSNSTGFYRLNASLVARTGAPLVTRITRLAKKSLEVEGVGFTTGSIVEVNGIARNTTMVSAAILRAKVKIKVGDVVTVINPPDARRSNPMLMQ